MKSAGAPRLGAPTLSAEDSPSIHAYPSLRVSDQNSFLYRAEFSLSPPAGASQHAHTPLSGVWTPILPKLIACIRALERGGGERAGGADTPTSRLGWIR